MHQNKRRKILFLVIGMLADEGQLYEILEGVEKLNDGRVDVAVECESDPQKIYKILEFYGGPLGLDKKGSVDKKIGLV
jgi:hypothetical protein